LGRGQAESDPEKGAERAEAFKADGETYLGDGHFSVGQQAFGFGEAATNEELVRRFAIDLAEGPKEMVLRKASDAGDVSEGYRFGEHCVQIVPCQARAPVQLVTCGGPNGVQALRVTQDEPVDSQESFDDVVEFLEKAPAGERLIAGTQTGQRRGKDLVVGVGFLEQVRWLRMVRQRVIGQAFGAEGEALENLSDKVRREEEAEGFDWLPRVDVDRVGLSVIQDQVRGLIDAMESMPDFVLSNAAAECLN